MEPNKQPQTPGPRNPLPRWLKRPLPSGPAYTHVTETLKELGLNTVCSGASCPNRSECYSCGTATFLIMGDTCTRNCAFCGIHHGTVAPLEDDEPDRLARAVDTLALRYVVITSVTRDDLPDGGARHFARTISAVRQRCPNVKIEVLTSDFQGDAAALDIVAAARPDVFNHNLETVRRLSDAIRSGARYDRSLAVLRTMAEKPEIAITKSGFMLGLGETDEEIHTLLEDLKTAKVAMLTIGQYLQPTSSTYPVQRYYRPEEFDAIGQRAREMGFKHVAAGPFVRSSYHAEQAQQQGTS